MSIFTFEIIKICTTMYAFVCFHIQIVSFSLAVENNNAYLCKFIVKAANFSTIVTEVYVCNINLSLILMLV